LVSLILAQSALEIVPKELENHPSVTSYCEKYSKKPSETLLDISWHFAAMKGIKNEIMRGRPDLIHLALLSMCNTPLYARKKLQVYVHTINDNVISLRNGVRPPKSYHRFQGLIEKLFKNGNIESDNLTLLELEHLTFEDLIKKIKPKILIGFSTQGENSTFEKAAEIITDNSCIVIGGFQKGHFSKEISKNFDHLKSLHENSLETHVVSSRILYEYEKTIFM